MRKSVTIYKMGATRDIMAVKKGYKLLVGHGNQSTDMILMSFKKTTNR